MRQSLWQAGAAVAVALGFVAVGLWMIGDRSAEDRLARELGSAARPERREAESGSLDALSLEAESAEAGTKAPETRPPAEHRPDEAAPETAAPERSPADPDGSLHLHGTMALIDLEGRRHDDVEGHFFLQYSEGVEVREGHWSTELRLVPETLHFSSIRVRDVFAHVKDEAIPVPDSGSLHVAVYQNEACVLRVVDALTGKDLEGVEVAQGFRSPPLVSEANSPVRLDVEARERSTALFASSRGPQKKEDTLELLVWAPGYSVGKTLVDFRSGHERLVALLPAGSLRVEVPDFEKVEGRDQEGLMLGGRRQNDGEESDPAFLRRWEPGRETDELTNLAEGRYSVYLQLGDSDGHIRMKSPVIDEREVEIVSGQTARVVLSAADFPIPEERIQMGGTLEANGPVESPFGIRFQRIDTPIARHYDSGPLVDVEPTGAPGLYTWRAREKVEPGVYRFWSARFGYEQTVRLERVRSLAVALQLPEQQPVSVVVEGHDELRAITWQTTGSGSNAVRREGPQHPFDFRAPAGEIAVRVQLQDSGDSWSASETFEVKPGPNLFRFVGAPTARIRVRYRQSGDWLDIFTPGLIEGTRVVPVERKQVDPREGSSGSRGFLYVVDRAGRYRVQPAQLLGYLPVEDELVDVELGEVSEVIFDLVRRF